MRDRHLPQAAARSRSAHERTSVRPCLLATKVAGFVRPRYNALKCKR